MKKIFENAIWWSGVAMAGLILGISLQFVRAWTEPSMAPPNGNVGAPINTGSLEQLKQGALGIVGLLKLYGGFQMPTGAQPGYVLTAQADPANPAISNGQAAWAAGGGGWYVPSDVKTTVNSHNGNFGGFKGMYDWIQSESNGCAGYHVCSVEELMRYYQFHSTGSMNAWINSYVQNRLENGAKADCEGWTDPGAGGTSGGKWEGKAASNRSCDGPYPVMCCK